MTPDEIKTIQDELDNKMSFEIMKDLTRDEYFVEAKRLLLWINSYKQKGLSPSEMKTILGNVYWVQADNVEDNEIFGNRFELLHDELFGHCNGSYFWEDDFDVYIKKWDNYYKLSYIL